MHDTRFWHSFADMHAVRSTGPLVIERGEGVHVYDSSGRRYVDAAAGLWNCNVGHGRVEIADAARQQMTAIEAFSTFGDYSNPPAEQLTRRLAEIAPMDDPAVFLTSGGSDSVDTAVKMVRRYWQVLGSPQRRVILSRTSAYHGMHLGGTSLAGIEPNRAGYGELLSDTERIPWDSTEELQKTIDNLGAEQVAAFVCEPVLGAGGIHFPPDGYLEDVARICRETGVLLIIDEVITGFGRAGDWFASSRVGIQPDLIVCAKGLTSGYLPGGAVLAGGRVIGPFFSGEVGPWRHGYTSAGNATVAAAALANLEIYAREGLLERSRQAEQELAAALLPLQSHRVVSEVRTGPALLAAVQLDPEAMAADSTLADRAVAGLRAHGVLTRAVGVGALQLSPPLVITAEQISELAERFDRALSDVDGAS